MESGVFLTVLPDAATLALAGLPVRVDSRAPLFEEYWK
jgi:hypothetical protein